METKTLFKTRYGSHLYGVNTPTSDQDFKSVVLLPLNVLLRGTSVHNSVNSTGDPNGKNTVDDVDEEFIPLQVFARAFFEGQTYALELAFALLSKDSNVTVLDDKIVEFTTELAEDYLTRNVNSMVGYAFNQAHRYGIKGKRLESINQFHYILKTHISLHGVNNKLSIVAHDVDAHSDKYLFNSEYNIGGYNPGMKPCVKLIDTVFPHSIDIVEALGRVEALKKRYGHRTKSAQESGGYDWKAISHAVRISGFAVELLKNKKIQFPLSEDERTLVMDIKQGNKTWDQVEEVINNRLEEIDSLLEITDLPEKTDELQEQFTSFLDGWLLEFYDFGTE